MKACEIIVLLHFYVFKVWIDAPWANNSKIMLAHNGFICTKDDANGVATGELCITEKGLKTIEAIQNARA